jgi:acyl-coenzyme A synthetase/AMP-(fatty) acid ligase
VILASETHRNKAEQITKDSSIHNLDVVRVNNWSTSSKNEKKDEVIDFDKCDSGIGGGGLLLYTSGTTSKPVRSYPGFSPLFNR